VALVEGSYFFVLYVYENKRSYPWLSIQLKKWAGRIMLMFISRYGVPNYSAPQNVEFAEYFRANISIQFLGPVMNVLMARSNGRFVMNEVTKLCIQYLTESVQLSPTYKLIKQHLDVLLLNILFPTLCITEEEEDLFDTDPTEYVKRVLSAKGEECLDPRSAALELLQMFAINRHNDLFPKFLPYVQTVLANQAATAASANSSSSAHRDALAYNRARDGAMLAVTTIADVFRANKKYRHIMPTFLSSHVLPDLSSPVPYIRARACWVIEHTQECDFVDPSGNKLNKTAIRNERLHAAIVGLLNGLKDNQFPVQTAAANAIGSIIKFETAANALRPLVPQLITVYFNIIAEDTENRDVLTTLQTVVLKFAEEVKPFAAQMIIQLQQIFLQLSGLSLDGTTSHRDNEDSVEEGSIHSGVDCLATITTVLDACGEDSSLFQQLEPVLSPLMHRLLREGKNSMEYLTAALEMLSYFTYMLDQFSPITWSLCGPLLEAMCGWGFDYMQEILSPLLNFVTKDIHSFLAGSHNNVSYVQWLLIGIEKGLASTESVSEHDARVSCTLLTCLLVSTGLNAPQTVDSLLPTIVHSCVFGRLQTCATIALKIQLLDVGLACIYYNAPLTFQLMDSCPQVPNGVQVFFGTLLTELQTHMNNQQSRRMIVYAFTKIISLMSSQSQGIPSMISNNVVGMFKEVVKSSLWVLKNDLEEANDSDDDSNGIFADVDDFEDDDIDADGMKALKKALKGSGVNINDEGFHEDEDCVDAEEEFFQQAVKDLASKSKNKAGQGEENLDGNDDDSDFEDMELARMDDFAFTMPSALQEVSVYVLSALQQVQSADPTLAATLLSSLQSDAEVKSQFDELVAAANAPRDEEA
jgi:hypothetical protein